MWKDIDNEKIGKKLTVGRVKELLSPLAGYKLPETFREISKAKEKDLLKGAIDMHIHAHPDVRRKHRYDIIDVCERAMEMEMKAVVFKCHYTMTADRAWIVERYCEKMAIEKGLEPLKVFGGVTLNATVGGLNVKLVEEAIQFPNFKIIWGPTFDALAHRREMGEGEEGGITALTPSGELRKEIREIINIVANADEKVSLSVGHFSPLENIKIVEASRDQGVDIVIDHVTQESTRLTLDQMKEVKKMGGYIGLHSLSCIPNLVVPIVDPYEAVSLIKDLGPSNIILASDQGHLINPNPIDCFKEFVKFLYAAGIDEHHLEIMIKENPTKILGI